MIGLSPTTPASVKKTVHLKRFVADEAVPSFAKKDSRRRSSQTKQGLKSVSVVVPVMNEADNLIELARQINHALEPTSRFFELVLVDDGSTDDSHKLLQRLVGNSTATQPIRAILLAGNFGQTAALKAGIDAAVGDYVVTLDGDLQNDPADIPTMLEQLDAGFEIVLGWRKQRQDHLWSRKVPSLIANRLIRHVTQTQFRDLGCALKAMTRDLAQRLELVGDMHRYIAVLANQLKAKCCQVPTNHRARIHGQTKYGLGRIKRVVLDLFVLKVLQHRQQPLHFFRGTAIKLASCSAASLSAAALAFLIFGAQWYLGLVAGAGLLLCLGALQFLSIGLLAELNVRQQIAKSNTPNLSASYRIQEVLTCDLTDQDGRNVA